MEDFMCLHTIGVFEGDYEQFTLDLRDKNEINKWIWNFSETKEDMIYFVKNFLTIYRYCPYCCSDLSTVWQEILPSCLHHLIPLAQSENL
jgi:hypothetical protein